MASLLPIIDQSFVAAVKYRSLGLEVKAAKMFRSLMRFQDLPRVIAEQTQLHLGEIALNQRRFKQAARHLSVALTYNENNATYHLLLGKAIAAGGNGNLKQAMIHFRACLKNDPKNVKALRFLGVILIHTNKAIVGIGFLARACKLQPNNLELLKLLVRHLQEQNLHDEARASITKALFLNNNNPKFKCLWNSFLFHEARISQKNTNDPSLEQRQVVLPFLKVVAKKKNPPAQGRNDGPESLPTPHANRSKWKKNQRRVK
jgi:tetratricopeptide (TPR) repeat protein